MLYHKYHTGDMLSLSYKPHRLFVFHSNTYLLYVYLILNLCKYPCNFLPMGSSCLEKCERNGWQSEAWFLILRLMYTLGMRKNTVHKRKRQMRVSKDKCKVIMFIFFTTVYFDV